jgi:hypothetical protein
MSHLVPLSEFNQCARIKGAQSLADTPPEPLRTADERVDALTQLKALQTLNLSGCKQLAKEAVEELREALPEANISF